VQDRRARCAEKNYALSVEAKSNFKQRSAVLLAQARIPSLDEIIAAMMQEDSRMELHSEAKGDAEMRSTLTVRNSSMTGIQAETRKCYNYGVVEHLSKACPKTPKESETSGREQTGSHGRGRGG
jgi:hypothetical protein